MEIGGILNPIYPYNSWKQARINLETQFFPDITWNFFNFFSISPPENPVFILPPISGLFPTSIKIRINTFFLPPLVRLVKYLEIRGKMKCTPIDSILKPTHNHITWI